MTLSGKAFRRSQHGNTNDTQRKLDLRLTRNAKRALQAAAAVSHRSVSDLYSKARLLVPMKRSPTAEASALTPQSGKRSRPLDAPPRPLPHMERLLKEPGFCDAEPNQ